MTTDPFEPYSPDLGSKDESDPARPVSERVPGPDIHSSNRPLQIPNRVLRVALWGSAAVSAVLAVRLVGRIGSEALGRDPRALVNELLILNLALALAAGCAIWLWRRRDAQRLDVREAEIASRDLERIQTVFDQASDPILTFGPMGQVRWANRAARALFERHGSPLEGETVQKFLNLGPDVAGEPGVLDTVIRSEAVRADGSSIPVELSVGCAGTEVDRTYTAVIRDISERVQIEERIRMSGQKLEIANRRLEEANAQLEEASRLKSEFLANTSHELRTPLNGMIGFLQLVLDGMCDSKDEEHEFLKQALECSRHLLGLINDVLDIAKIEAGKLTLDIEPIDARSLFGDVYTLTHVQAAQKGLKLVFEAPEEQALPVRGDFGKIKQVLVNLIGNSLKFTPHGSITVRALERPELGHWLFEVVDTGIGINADRHRMIFEKFTQGDGSTTRRYGGTGLGLAISRSLVELMGGIIGVESEGEGKGTRIFFSLPVWRPDSELEGSVETQERIEGPTGGALVLVVEDDGVFRQFLATLLHKHGYRTVEAASAEIGWLLVRRLSPAVVILDYALSCAEAARLRTGWDLAERMAGDSATRHIPLVFLTGFDGQIKEKLESTPFARKPEHLMKPVDGSVLLARIEDAVGSRADGVVRVLLADDDPTVAAFVRKVLPENRFNLQVANNGDECLHALRTQPNGFDLLLLDLMMPEVSGYDVLRELALTGMAGNLKVLVLTNNPEAREEGEQRLLERGLVLDVIAKPAVHQDPAILPHLIEWHLQVAFDKGRIAETTEADEDDDTRRAAA